MVAIVAMPLVCMLEMSSSEEQVQEGAASRCLDSKLCRFKIQCNIKYLYCAKILGRPKLGSASKTKVPN